MKRERETYPIPDVPYHAQKAARRTVRALASAYRTVPIEPRTDRAHPLNEPNPIASADGRPEHAPRRAQRDWRARRAEKMMRAWRNRDEEGRKEERPKLTIDTDYLPPPAPPPTAISPRRSSSEVERSFAAAGTAIEKADPAADPSRRERARVEGLEVDRASPIETERKSGDEIGRHVGRET